MEVEAHLKTGPGGSCNLLCEMLGNSQGAKPLPDDIPSAGCAGPVSKLAVS